MSLEGACSQFADSGRFERALMMAMRNRIMNIVSERYPLFALEIENRISREFSASLEHAQRVSDEKEEAVIVALGAVRQREAYPVLFDAGHFPADADYGTRRRLN